MILKTAPEMDTRILSWSEHVKQPPELLIEGVLNEALDDWEDYFCTKILYFFLS